MEETKNGKKKIDGGDGEWEEKMDGGPQDGKRERVWCGRGIGSEGRQSTEGACTDDSLSRKPGFLLSAVHSRALRWLSAAPLVFLFLGFLPLQIKQICRILCVMYGEEGAAERTLFICLFAKDISY